MGIRQSLTSCTYLQTGEEFQDVFLDEFLPNLEKDPIDGLRSRADEEMTSCRSG